MLRYLYKRYHYTVTKGLLYKEKTKDLYKNKYFIVFIHKQSNKYYKQEQSQNI